MYLSRWPGGLATALVMSPEGKGNSFADDMVAEGYATPLTVRLTRLDETAVKSAIVLANRFMVYNDFGANCSSHVRVCLEAGQHGLPKVGSAFTHGGLLGFAFSDTPPGVYAYAQGLRAVYG